MRKSYIEAQKEMEEMNKESQIILKGGENGKTKER